MVPNGWKLTALGDISTNIQTGPFGSQLHAHEYTNEGVAVMMPKDLINNKVNVVDAAKIPESRAADLKKHILKKGDILFSRRGDVARFGLVTDESKGSICGTGCLKVSLNSNHSPLFISYFLQNSFVRKWLEQNAVGQTMLNLNTTILSELPLIVAESKLEQQKIAKILSTWDKAISTTERLIENSTQQKKALMQQLLTGKKRLLNDEGKRFEGEWEEVKLGDISNITTGSSNRADSSLDAEYAFFDRSLDVRRSSIYLFDSEAVIVAGEGQEFVPKHFIGKFDLHQRTYAIMDYKNAIGKFLYYYITFNRHYFLAQAVGSTVKSLRLPMFKKMPIQLPSVEEQQKIAAVLTNADKEIELLEQQLADLQQEKKALMQVLLTGKKRVRIDEIV